MLICIWPSMEYWKIWL